MSQTFIPGWQTGITVDLADLTVVGAEVDFQRSRASLPKATFGTPFRHEIPGQAGGTLAIQGHVSVEQLPNLEAIFAKDEPVAFTLQAGTVSAPTEAGSWSGNISITSYGLQVGAESEWDFTLDGTLDGEPVYTAPTP